MTANALIKVGPAGWSYKDWEGIVYPEKPGARFDPLEYLSRFFDTIEINSTFYRPPTPKTTKAWAKRVSGNPKFTFTSKLNQIFTHQRGKATAQDEKDFRDGLAPLVSASRLGAVLMQFPWSFKNGADERRFLFDLIRRFREYPLVLEVRHLSWSQPEIYETLEELGVGICNIDQPLFSKSIKPSALTTSSVGYVRLHGRNYENWFREKADRDDRYNYLYSLEQLEPWIAKINQVAHHTKETYVITNNHFRGQAVVNAIEIKSTLAERKVEAPTPLFATYPRLANSAVPQAEESSNAELFPRV